jgi:DNA-binding IclR family transcriptional regulator
MDDASTRTIDGDTDLVQSVVRAARILQCFSGHSHRLNLSDVARCCKLNVATTYRLLRTLCATGLLRRDPGSETYEIGAMWLRLAETGTGAEAPVPAAGP